VLNEAAAPSASKFIAQQLEAFAKFIERHGGKV
jgi:hypothetical protein